jgi:hypothetical protein
MAEKTLEDYWNASFDMLYDAYFHELASERIISSWNLISSAILFFTAFAALLSVDIGAAFWGSQTGKIIWGCIAAVAAVFAIFHIILAVPSRVKKEEERRQRMASLRVALQQFRNNLPLGRDVLKAGKAFDALSERLHGFILMTPQDIVLTNAARKAVQDLVNEKLKRYIDG